MDTTIGEVAKQTKTTFSNGVEESVWVSFVCALVQGADDARALTPAMIAEAADDLLEKYRERLSEGKPAIK